LNIAGPMFHGSSSLAMGVNEHLGWAMTWNHMRKADVFKLHMHPRKKLFYEIDGQWEKLEKRPVWLKVKIKGIVVPVRKISYWSKYGATLKSEKSGDFYAIRFGANQTIKTPQQLYEMNKAKNLNEFWKALRNNALALFNIVYADKEGNIFYLSNGEIPDRNLKYDWRGIIPGNRSDNLWTRLLPNDSLPHVINPDCGYVMNTNNTPFDATCENRNDDPNRYPRYLIDERPGNNNRAIRLKELLSEREKFSFDDLKRIKFDYRISDNSPLIKSLKPLFGLDTLKYPEFSTALRILLSWDKVCDTNSYGTAVLGAFIQSLFEKRNYSDEAFVSGFSLTEEEVVEHLREAIKYMREKFGSEVIRWGDVHVNHRANKIIPLNGFPDVLSPSYPRLKQINGKNYLVPKHGDTYTMLVSFNKQGPEKIFSLLPTGNSQRKDSPYYTNQMELFRDVQLKAMTLAKHPSSISGIKVYHPE
ncbi:MAG: penicillin acylase family protein, partial [Chitinophagales bacterium]|nr:penicillin acylase family protein [Chitinophagales bacterium]MDW8273772.1 penicillin acylase family protein [Chitinophagales bacterium]